MYKKVNQDELTNIQKSFDKNAVFCRLCGKSVWYRNTKVYLLKNNSVSYEGTTYLTKKNIMGTTYSLTCCENCMCEKFQDFSEKNVSRIFNTCNKYTEYGFELPNGIVETVNKKKAITLKNCIEKYGEVEGKLVYEKYCQKQSYKNTFEYKKEKYNWTKDDFDNYNKSRGVTIENLVKKHGEDVGMQIYNDYVNKQHITKSKEYVVEKYGNQHWEDVCKSKGCSLESYVNKYGETLGLEKYLNVVDKRTRFTSNMSTNYFNNLISFGGDVFSDLKCYYGKDSEFGFYSKEYRKYYCIDFCIPSIKLAIEFNGNYFHANPKYYQDCYCEFWFTKKTAKEIWEDDNKKNSAIQNLGYTLFVVWEDDIENVDIKNEIINFIKNKRNELSI